MATTLLTNEPLGLSLTPRMEMDLRESQVRAPAPQKMTSMHLAALGLGCRMSDLGSGLRCELFLRGHSIGSLRRNTNPPLPTGMLTVQEKIYCT